MDWLEQGHGRGDSLQPMIKGSSTHGAHRVSIRGVLRSAEVKAPRKSRRRTKALAGWLIYCCTAVGGTAAAFTVRDTLFPSLGSPPALWVSSKPTVTVEHGSNSTAQADTTLGQGVVAAAVVGETSLVSLAAVAEDQTVPPAAATNQGPDNSVENHGNGGVAPVTGTTVAEDPGKGQNPVSPVADNPTESSTPSSASTPPTSGNTTSTATSTPPTTPASADGQRGKGGGSGGGDGGNGGGGKPPAP